MPRPVSKNALCHAAVLLSLAGNPLAHADTVTWIPDSNGFWNIPINWSSSPFLPDSTSDVLITQPDFITVTLANATTSINSLTDNDDLELSNTSLTVATTLQLNGTLGLSNSTLQNAALSIAPTASLNFDISTLSNVTLAGTLSHSAGTATLAGTITNNATWTANGFFIVGTTALNGNGTILLGSSTLSGSGTLATLNIGANQTLRGGPHINSSLTINNSGIINATSTVTYNLPASTSLNNGTIECTNGQNLSISGYGNTSVLDNTGGILEASGGVTAPSRISIGNALVSGGNISTDTMGQIVLGSGAAIANASFAGNVVLGDVASLSNVTLSGSLKALAGTSTSLTLAGNITNTAAWTTPIIATLGGPTTFAGLLNSNAQNTSTTLSLGNFTLVNNGTLEATNNASLAIQGSNATLASLNNANGILSASAPAANLPSTIALSNLSLDGGQLSTDALSTITLANVTLANATVSGNLLTTNSATFSNDTFNGTLSQSAAVTLSGNITNNANWTQAGYSPSLTISNAVALNGNGTLSLNNATISGGGTTPTLSIGPSQTLLGTGNVSNLLINNAGIIHATGNLTINYPAGTFTNAGFLESSGGGILALTGPSGATFFDNSNGTLTATGTSIPGNSNPMYASYTSLAAVTFSGGQLTTDAIGHIAFSNSTISNVIASGNVGFVNSSLANNTFSGNVTGGGNISLAGTITNNAAWIQNPNAGFNQIRVSSNATITGSGSINFRGLTFVGPGVLTIGQGQILTGNGSIAGSITFVNNGLLSASGGFIVVAAKLTNNGTVEAPANATLLFNAPPTNLAANVLTGGTWIASGNGTIALPSAISTNAATISLSDTASFPALANLSLNQGSLTLNNNYAFSTTASLTNTGTLIVGANSTLTAPQLLLNAGTLRGTGTIAANVLAGAAPHTLHPGLPGSSAPATLTLSSLTTNPNTSFAFNLLSPATASSPSSNDQLTVTTLSLNGGSLQFTSLPTGPAALGYYQLLHYHSLSSLSLTLPAAPPNLVYTLDTTRDPNTLDLHIGFLGDTNDDGTIDLNDLNTVLNNLGSTTASWTAGNFDGASTIDLNDLNAVLNHLGVALSIAPSAALLPAASPAPEPASLLLLAPLAFAVLRRRPVCV